MLIKMSVVSYCCLLSTYYFSGSVSSGFPVVVVTGWMMSAD